jgi:hypothetical protein
MKRRSLPARPPRRPKRSRAATGIDSYRRRLACFPLPRSLATCHATGYAPAVRFGSDASWAGVDRRPCCRAA